MPANFDTYPLLAPDNWKGWVELKPQSEVSKKNELDDAKNEPGLYRIRHPKFARLVYIGESSKVRRRMSTLANKIQQEKMPYRDPHTAAMSLWSYINEYGGSFEVSWIEPEYADQKRWRKGMEAGLLCLYRLNEGNSTISNYGRIHPGYTKSKRRKTGVRGGKVEDHSMNRNEAKPHPKSSWFDYSNPRSKTWMGYHWSEKYSLRAHEQVSYPDNIVYRLTQPVRDHELAYIGETSDPVNRMRGHYNDFGDEVAFEFTSTGYMNAKSRRLEVETDLIGVYYLIYGYPPSEQFTDEYKPTNSSRSANSDDQTEMMDY